ncbi:hypothetical protein HU200_041422 [Digitaria exilis]|uniref:Uncharacterized protein n=1 Tax=Digitaria exilis TaxID=1010633 RepID=A0A835EGQ8_9POAL|nr:hypothetical protein HU200_041422 [Digitaria exilis]
MVRLVVAAFFLLAAVAAMAAAAGEPEAEAMSSYIVHVAATHAPRSPSSSSRPLALTAAYASFLHDHLPTELHDPTPGFAARLTGPQAAHLEAQPAILAVVPDEMLQLHTTMTPSFLRLSPSSGLIPAADGATDVVIGVIDSGIYPLNRDSFAADPQLPPPPNTFRGGCVSTPSFNATAFCNNKLVGAKFFHKGNEAVTGTSLSAMGQSMSPLDDVGHGTHTASTAAGSTAGDASFFKYGKGTAAGVAPGARIAVYKACWKTGCASSDILAAFEAAIEDGVDVISISVGGNKGKGCLLFLHPCRRHNPQGRAGEGDAAAAVARVVHASCLQDPVRKGLEIGGSAPTSRGSPLPSRPAARLSPGAAPLAGAAASYSHFPDRLASSTLPNQSRQVTHGSARFLDSPKSISSGNPRLAYSPDGITSCLMEWELDSLATGAFRAVRDGIIASASTGNTGPAESTVSNVAPWILTVGASTINRLFPDTVVLGNGETFTGTSLYAGGAPLSATEIPLVHGGDAGSRFCEAGKLNTSVVAGKIVLCDFGLNRGVEKGEAVKLAGGAGAILAGIKELGEFAYASPHMFPTTAITFVSTEKIRKYMSTDASPVATIVFHGTVVGGRTPSSPRMASFSSRGPNTRAPEILKPDVTAPGVNILAAWTGESSPSQLDTDRRRVRYNIISGTSMSCPHVSGVAALLRQARPDWSPAAIKSALMTTAYNVDDAGDVIRDMATSEASTPFARGSGHVDPNRALDPGSVYDADADDYVPFLCALGYTGEQIAIITDDSEVDCSAATAGDLNYPAFSAVFGPTMKEVTQRRTVRNVGCNFRATYTASVTSPAGVRVTVKPGKLRFDAKQRTQGYEITFTPQGAGNLTDKYSFGSIVWSDGEHRVASPIAITWPWPARQVAAM